MADIPKHGYSLEADSLVAIQASFDAVVDQIIRATVCFDGPAHLAIVGALQARIARSEPAVTLKVAQLVKANPAILAGDAA